MQVSGMVVLVRLPISPYYAESLENRRLVVDFLWPLVCRQCRQNRTRVEILSHFGRYAKGYRTKGDAEEKKTEVETENHKDTECKTCFKRKRYRRRNPT